MTKEIANKIKKLIKSNLSGTYTFYYQTRTEQLRVSTITKNLSRNAVDTEEEQRICIAILNLLTENGLRPKYYIDKKIYQGYLDCRYIVFK